MNSFRKMFAVILSVVLLTTIIPVTSISVYASTNETWRWPTLSPKGITISSSFGYRNTSNNTHKAIDISCKMGTAVLATKSGTVYKCEQKYGSSEKTSSGGTKSWGNYIILKHKDGTYSLYAHLSKDSKTVPKGKEVKQGDVIAYSGDSGHSSGPHLHFSARSYYGSSWSNSDGLINVMPTEEFIGKYNMSYTRYELPDGWPSTRMAYLDLQKCEHQYEKNYELAHSHAEYKVCKCGSKIYTGKHKKETNCSLCKNPLLYSFDTVDGKTVYTYSKQHDVTITIFSHNQCNNSKKLIQVIAQNTTLLKNSTQILFVDTNKNTKQTVSALKKSLGASKVEFCYDLSDKAYNAMWKYANDAGFGGSITLPIIVFTKKDGTVFKVLQGDVEPDYFFQLAKGDLSQDMSVNLNISGTENYNYANEVLKKLNDLRKRLNLQALTMDQTLLSSAMQRAAEISIYYSHTRPNGTNCKTVSNTIKINAENIAIGQSNPAAVINSWTNSSGHYKNMTTADFKSVGIGCFTTSEGYLCWVQIFSKDSPSAATKSGKVSATHVIKANAAHLSLAVYADKDPHMLKKGESTNFRVENINKGFNYVVQKLNISDFSFKSNNDVVSFNLEGDCVANGTGKVTVTVEHKQSEAVKTHGLYTIGHNYTNSCDTICNVCNAKRTIKHTYKTTTTKATLKKNGSVVKKCTVCGKKSTTTIKYAKTFTLSKTSYAYDGKVKEPTVTVKDSAGKTLKKNTDYTVTYASGRKNVGTYKVTIKFKGNYTGTETLTFKIIPKTASINTLTSGSKKIIVKLNRSLQQSTGYQIQYSTNKNFKNAKTKTITSYKTSSTTLTGLKAKTTYYIRVRTYKTVGKTKYYSNWASRKYKKTK